MGCNANVRIYRYGIGQRFGKHVDESVEDENGHLSQWTVLIYLNGGTEGAMSAEAGSGSLSIAGSGVAEPLRGGSTVFYKVNKGCCLGLQQFVLVRNSPHLRPDFMRPICPLLWNDTAERCRVIRPTAK